LANFGVVVFKKKEVRAVAMKKFLPPLFFLLFLLSFTGCGNVQKNPVAVPVKHQFINIAAGPVSSDHHMLGRVLAEVLNKAIAGMNAGAQTTDALVTNVELLSSGKVELAIVRNDLAYDAVAGQNIFADKSLNNLWGIAALHKEAIYILAPERSGINSIAEIKGKQIAVSAFDLSNVLLILNEYGLTEQDVKIQRQPLSEAINALTEGGADAVFITSASPGGIVRELALKEKIVFLSIDDDKIDSLLSKNSFYMRQIIPAGTYNGQDKPVNTIGVTALLLANDKIDEQMGYNIARAIYNNLSRIQRANHPAFREISKAGAAAGMSIPFNPGAEKFLKE
jgi:TRAP transporter TAXI family solute receptor